MRTIELTRHHRVALRSRDGDACVWTGRTDTLAAVTRDGSTSDALDNVLLLDPSTLHDISYDTYLMSVALAWSFTVPGNVNPADVPVFYAHEHAWYALEGDTRRRIESVEAIDRMLTVYGDAWAWWNATARDTPQSHALATRGGNA